MNLAYRPKVGTLTCPPLNQRTEQEWCHCRMQALSRCPALESLELRHFQAASAVGLSAVASDDAVPRLARLIVALDGSVSAGGLVELQRKRPKVIVAPAFS